MIKLRDFGLSSFKDSYPDFGEYILSKLRSTGEITVDECTAKLKSEKFAGATRFLKNTDRVKTVATAFHILIDGKVHHYDIDVYRFKREKPSDGPSAWQRLERFSLRDEEAQALHAFLEEQNKLIGISFNDKIATVVFSEKEIDTNDLLQKVSVIAQSPSGRGAIEKIIDKITEEGDEHLLTIGFTEDVIGKRRKELNDFEALINSPDIKEVGDVQKALKEIPWIFGPEYTSYDYREAGSGVPDGRLKRVDGLSDILEVKLPSAEVLREDSQKRIFLSPDTSQAIGQLIGYLEFYHSEYSTDLSDDTKEEIQDDRYEKYYRPKGVLLIGRRSKSDMKGIRSTSDNHPKLMRRMLSYHHGLEILTYDDLIERARNALDNIEKSKE
jgi:hypothetical protein